MTSAVLLCLAALGALLSVWGVWLTMRETAYREHREQRVSQHSNLVTIFEAAKDEPGAAEALAQQDLRFRLAMGRSRFDREPELTLSEHRRANLSRPMWLTLAGICISAVAGMVGILVQG